MGSVLSNVQAAVDLLVQARCYAEETGSDPWEFAVEMELLTDLGLTANDFRWLVRSGQVYHQREVTLEGEDGRAFHPSGDLSFPVRTCFVLTDHGRNLAAQLSQQEQAPANGSRRNGLKSLALEQCSHDSGQRAFRQSEPVKPHWDADLRELKVRATLVKRYKWQAVNQEIVLGAFEEEGWPRRIDDPLPPHPEQDSKRRLCDTIKCLNRKQCEPLIRFHGDGTGEGITWEIPVATGETQRT